MRQLAPLLSVAAVCSCPSPPASTDAGVQVDDAWLVVEDREASSDRGAADAVGAWMLWAASSAHQRLDLLDRLHELDATIAAHSSPLALDLGEDRPSAVRAALQTEWLPRWTAARVLASGQWRVASGRRARATFGRRPDAPLVHPLLPPTDEPPASRAAAEQARFAAWPLAYAVWLDCSSAADLARGIDRARSWPSTALVLTPDVAAGRLPQRSDALQSIARRLVRRLRSTPESAPLLSALAADPPRGAWLPWIRIRRSEALVVPRLATLARNEGAARVFGGAPSCRLRGRGKIPA